MKVEWFEKAYNWKNPEDLYKICIKQQKEIKRLKEEYKTTCEQKNKYISTLEGNLGIAEERYLKLHSIIKETRENINKKLNINSDYVDYDFGTELLRQELLEILDKENK